MPIRAQALHPLLARWAGGVNRTRFIRLSAFSDHHYLWATPHRARSSAVAMHGPPALTESRHSGSGSGGSRSTHPTTLPNASTPRIAHALFAAAKAILDQYSDLLRYFEQCPQTYTAPSRFVAGSTVGKHVRHVLDHFDTLVQSTSTTNTPAPPSPSPSSSSSPPPPPTYLSLHYDGPPRRPSHATCARSARAHLQRLVVQLDAIAGRDLLERRVAIAVVVQGKNKSKSENKDCDDNNNNNNDDSGDDPVFESTLGREIWFLCHHAIHHAALIRCICVEHDIPIPATFGIAPSTQKHRAAAHPNTNNNDNNNNNNSSNSSITSPPSPTPTRSERSNGHGNGGPPVVPPPTTRSARL
ncbi:hypothetical protein DFJ77DRAFT_480915 [Powellomyces hirtus]|nr:hypothetical protein DFJ77DRAFT_480915 [Powellomyces hirtus]